MLGVEKIIFVGHSVSAIMGVIAAKEAPELFKALILVSPSPSFINDGDYIGGFTRPKIEEPLETLESNHLGWSMAMAPVANAYERRNEEKQPLFIRFILFKATDRQVYERNLKGAKKQAEQSLEEERTYAVLREQFIAVLGHDLRNPLSAILSGSSLLLMQ